MATDRPISIRLPKAVLVELARRTSRSKSVSDREYGRADAIRAALQRYYEVCRRHLAALGLSRHELALCCDALNGVWLDADTDHAAAQLAVVWAGIADAIHLNGLAEKHGVDDPAALVERLRAASYGDLVALVDFAERFWADDEPAAKAVAPDREP